MPTQLDLICALDEPWLRDDVVWLAKRITWRDLDETEDWLARIEIPIKFSASWSMPGLRFTVGRFR